MTIQGTDPFGNAKKVCDIADEGCTTVGTTPLCEGQYHACGTCMVRMCEGYVKEWLMPLTPSPSRDIALALTSDLTFDLT